MATSEPPLNGALVHAIDALLPQTQCTRCGYPDCWSYAQAIAAGAADINRCPPGGETTIVKLAMLTGESERPLDQSCGEHRAPKLAVVDEQWCIGCTLCIQACPVDAIIGGAKRMHAVLKNRCTGCELCLDPCPVECIEMRDFPALARLDAQSWLRERADEARRRYRARQTRLRTASTRRAAQTAKVIDEREQRRQYIAAAVARARLGRESQR